MALPGKDFVEAWGRRAECPATTLTELARIIEREASRPGIDASLRCAMIKANDAPPASTLSRTAERLLAEV